MMIRAEAKFFQKLYLPAITKNNSQARPVAVRCGTGSSIHLHPTVYPQWSATASQALCILLRQTLFVRHLYVRVLLYARAVRDFSSISPLSFPLCPVSSILEKTSLAPAYEMSRSMCHQYHLHQAASS